MGRRRTDWSYSSKNSMKSLSVGVCKWGIKSKWFPNLHSLQAPGIEYAMHDPLANEVGRVKRTLNKKCDVCAWDPKQATSIIFKL